MALEYPLLDNPFQLLKRAAVGAQQKVFQPNARGGLGQVKVIEELVKLGMLVLGGGSGDLGDVGRLGAWVP